MRDDMHEIVIERPRWGHQMRHDRRARRVDPKRLAMHDPDALPSRIGHRRAAKLGRQYKHFSDNLAPLKRYLMRQVNRPWDKVWSDISANLKAGNTIHQHVRDHVQDFVATSTSLKAGVVWVMWRNRPIRLEESRQELYVDPRTGILRRNKLYKRHSTKWREQAAAEARERAGRMRELGPLRQLHLLQGCWWEVTLAVVHDLYVPWPGPDVVIGSRMSTLPAGKLYGRRYVYATKKRQLTSAEIARYGLKT